MCSTSRKARSAAAIAFGMSMAVAVSAACGGRVELPSQDDAALDLRFDLRSESLDELSGLEPAPLPEIATSAAATVNTTVSSTNAAFTESAAPRATVIPLPAGVWSGLIGLGTLAVASAVRKIARSA